MARVVAVELQVPDDLAPVVQDVELVDEWNACALQVRDRSNDISVPHVAKRIIVQADDQPASAYTGSDLESV